MPEPLPAFADGMANRIAGLGVVGLDARPGMPNVKTGAWDLPGELDGGDNVLVFTLEFLRTTRGVVSGRRMGAGETERSCRGPRGRVWDCMSWSQHARGILARHGQ